MASSPSSSPVATTTINTAVSSLLKWKQSQTQKPKLIPDDEFLYLILTLKKIPTKPRTNAYKIPLPHPLHSSPEICLIVNDPDSQRVKQIVKSQNFPVSKVLRLSKLKANYKPFEAKRKLCDSFDLFLADKRVLHLLPKLIGKGFFRKSKLPVPVDIGKKNWRGEVEKVKGRGLLYFRTGTCCVVKVGNGGMDKGEIQENVREAIDRVVGFVENKWVGVRSLHLKFADSVALPLYQALPDLKMRIEGVVEERGNEGETERKSVGKKKDKGRIHEVRYMDVALIEGDSNDEMEVIDDEGEESKAVVKKGNRKREIVAKSKEGPTKKRVCA